MKAEDILDAVGGVDDEYVKEAKTKIKNKKILWIAAGSLAACLLLAAALPMFFSGNEPLVPESSEALAPAFDSVWIYYVEGENICREEQFLPLAAKDVFEAWRIKNGLGEEVGLLLCRIDDNGETTYSEFSGMGIAEYTLGDYFILNITVSKTIENYYNEIEPQLLLDSLEQTMRGYPDIEFDEYHLSLE